MVGVRFTAIAVRDCIVVCVRSDIVRMNIDVIARKDHAFRVLVFRGMRIRLSWLKIQAEGDHSAKHCKPSPPTLVRRSHHSNANYP